MSKRQAGSGLAQASSGDAEAETRRLRNLLDAGRLIAADIDHVPERVLKAARELTGARYAALGILDERRGRLEHFLTAGLDEATRAQMGELPRGLGVLGLLIEDPRPLRLADVTKHPRSHGFPPGHPTMRSFLGVPILVSGEAWGNLYLTEKAGGGEFTGQDEETAVVLAGWAAVALQNLRLYKTSEARRVASEKARGALEAARDLTRAVSGDLDPGHTLELIAQRARELVGAEEVTIWLPDGGELEMVASAGRDARDARPLRLPREGTTIGAVLQSGRAQLLDELDVQARDRVAPQFLGLDEVQDALVVPMLHLRGSRVGVIVALHHSAPAAFTDEDELVLWTFAASAASTVEIIRRVEDDRLRVALHAAEAERARWARELHDDTLQGMAALRMRVSFALRQPGMPPSAQEALRDTMEDIERQIKSLRNMILQLRPATLDQLGLRAGIESILGGLRERGATEIEHHIRLSSAEQRGAHLDPEFETTVYRLTQEALTNIVKHADATRVEIEIVESPTHVTIRVCDNGRGFDPRSASGGFGLSGMRERVELVGGTLQIDSDAAGTAITAQLPVRCRRPPPGALDEAPSHEAFPNEAPADGAADPDERDAQSTGKPAGA